MRSLRARSGFFFIALVLACGGTGGGGSAEPEHACGTPGSSWQRCKDNPVVRGWQAGPAAGQFLWTMADPSILYDADARLWKAWWSSVVAATCADVTSLDSRAIEIFYAESVDGIVWTLQAEPALPSKVDASNWDDTTVETPTVLRDPNAAADRRYVLIYGGGNDHQFMIAGRTGWQLGLAFSPDGRHFTRISAADSPYAGKVTPFTGIDGLLLMGKDLFPGFAGTEPIVSGAVADPDLSLVGGTYHLFFGALGIDASGAPVVNAEGTRVAYGIGHATSTDLFHWAIVAGENPVLVGAGQPTVVRDDQTSLFHMWYSQDPAADLQGIPSALFPTRGFFHATSSDGTVWATEAAREFTWDAALPTETFGLLNGPAVVRSGDEYRLYYGAWGTDDVPAGSCVYVSQSGAITSVPGVYGLNLATRKAP